MARTALSAQFPSRSGLNATYTAPSGTGAGEGIKFTNTGIEVVHVKNADSNPTTITVITPNTVDGQAIGDRSVTVPAASERFLGGWPTSTYNNSDDSVYMEFSNVTAVTCAVIKPSQA